MVRFGWEDGGTNSAFRAACRVGGRLRGGRALLPSLLHPTDSAPCFACRAVLRAALDRKDATASLVITPFSHLRLVGARHCRVLNLPLAISGSTTRTIRGWTLSVGAFIS